MNTEVPGGEQPDLGMDDPPGEGFVDGEQDLLVGSKQQRHDQAGQDQADQPDVPAGVGEESVSPGM